MTMGKQYDQLTVKEREHISVLKAQGKSLRTIASIIGRHHSTLSRELRRNNIISTTKHSLYFPVQAQHKASSRKAVAAKRKRLKDQAIRRYVAKKLRIHWSPEQIAGRISLDLPGLHISHEAIYQYVYEDAWHLFDYLARKRKRRRMRFNFQKACKPSIPDRTWIDDRPIEIHQRLSPGHWESDSAVSTANLTSLHVLLERKSRLMKISKIKRNTSRCVSRTILRKLSTLPSALRLSLTYDNGSENRLHKNINRRLKTLSFFCHPYHSWEKGSVENSIGLIRRFLPKKTDFAKLSKAKIQKIENMINNRPRKCLSYRTPTEVFNSFDGALAG